MTSYFRTIGCTRVFKTVEVFDYAGFIPAVKGKTLDGKHQTVARIADVIFIEE